MKAREFLAQAVGEKAMKVRHLLKEPLTIDELRKLATMAGGAENLVAPKRRAEAAGLSGDKLLAWLAADGGHVRRPIIVQGKTAFVGFAKDTQAALAAAKLGR